MKGRYMDQVIINTPFMKGIIGSVVENMLKKNGIHATVNIKEAKLTHEEGKRIKLHLNIEASSGEDDISKLVSR